MAQGFNNGIVTSVFILCLSVISIHSQASGVRSVSEQYLVNNFSHICILDVNHVETKENIQTFKNGTSRRISSSLTMKATPIKSLKGDCGASSLTTIYTTPITVTFNEDGLIEKRYTIIKTSSGLEMKVEVGQRYIVSFYDVDQNAGVQRHYRVNAIADSKRLKALIANQDISD